MNPAPPSLRIDIWHNILWSKYKGEVFSSLHAINNRDEFDIRFFQMAETEGNRVGLGTIDLEHHRYPFDLLFKGNLNNVGLFTKLKAILTRTLRSDADLVVLSGYEKPECWAQLLVLRLRGRKIALFCDSTIYDNQQRFVRGIFKKIFFKGVDGIFGYGERSKEYVVHYGANPEHVFHRCQAAALPISYDPKRALAARVADAPSVEAPRFLYVGRLSQEKGLNTLLESFSKVYALNKRASLVLVGNGPMQKELSEQAGLLGIEEAVSFAGSKSGDALFSEYTKATAFVLPSTSEPWGLVVNEALSFGCPVIVSHICGCVPELVTAETGFVHTAGDANDLASKMKIAPAQFSDIEKTAQSCLALMSYYTPDQAAKQILAGCRKIMSGLQTHKN